MREKSIKERNRKTDKVNEIQINTDKQRKTNEKNRKDNTHEQIN